MKRVKVVWSDAAHHGPGEWIDIDVDPRAYVTTVAYLKRKSKTHLFLYQSRIGDEYSGVFTIPRSAVLKMKRL